ALTYGVTVYSDECYIYFQRGYHSGLTDSGKRFILENIELSEEERKRVLENPIWIFLLLAIAGIVLLCYFYPELPLCKPFTEAWEIIATWLPPIILTIFGITIMTFIWKLLR
ncbi:MAG: hypothetical protein QME47_07085, partial [Candidatus Thermoplasmatota archaeon]|nr:hypothetical protein [Candidatus Thermoplasmatota archaeon]